MTKKRIKRTYSVSSPVGVVYPCHFASSRSVSYFESVAVVAAVAYIVEAAAAAVAFPLANATTRSASGRDVAVAYASAFLAPFRDGAVVAPVQANP